MILTATHAKKDPIMKWTEDYVPAPYFPVNEYQERLNQIAGVLRDQPILKLEWGGNEKVLSPTKWSNGVPIENEWRPKHALKKKHPYLLGVIMYIPIRRWIITQWQTPEQLMVGIEDTFTDEMGVSNLVGEKPKKGDYTPLIYIGDHTLCPKDCNKNRVCLGDYKHPGLPELDWVLEKTYLLQTDRIGNPFSPVFTQSEEEKIRKEVSDEQEKKTEKADALFDEESLDWFKVHGHRITEDDPSVLSHGKYKFYKDGRPI